MHYYAAIREDGTNRLLDVLCYDHRDERDNECRPEMFHGGFHRVPITAREARRLTRKLFGLRPREKFYGHFEYIDETRYTDYLTAFAPRYIAHL